MKQFYLGKEDSFLAQYRTRFNTLVPVPSKGYFKNYQGLNFSFLSSYEYFVLELPEQQQMKRLDSRLKGRNADHLIYFPFVCIKIMFWCLCKH
jgi:hypothetical protein